MCRIYSNDDCAGYQHKESVSTGLHIQNIKISIYRRRTAIMIRNLSDYWQYPFLHKSWPDFEVKKERDSWPFSKISCDNIFFLVFWHIESRKKRSKYCRCHYVLTARGHSTGCNQSSPRKRLQFPLPVWNVVRAEFRVYGEFLYKVPD